MSPDERTRIELTQRLADLFGDDLAAYLMETVPPFSWHEVATKRDLRDLEGRLDVRFDQLERSVDVKIGNVDSKIDERTSLLRAEARELQQETIAVLRGELVAQHAADDVRDGRRDGRRGDVDHRRGQALTQGISC